MKNHYIKKSIEKDHNTKYNNMVYTTIYLCIRRENIMNLNYSQTTQEIINKVNCPYQVFTKNNTTEEIQNAYEQAVIEGKKKGFVPILVVSDDTFAEWLGILEDEEYSKEKIISQERKDAKEILKKRFKEYTEGYIDDINGKEAFQKNDMLLSEFMGEKEGGGTLLKLSGFINYKGDIQETILFEIPVKYPWEVIAWIPMGGWNECPDASEMMEICRYWYEQYGAVPSMISHDILEFTVEKLADCKENAWELAKEHYAFCPDRVEQCTRSGTLGEVADCISKSTVWYFWWD